MVDESLGVVLEILLGGGRDDQPRVMHDQRRAVALDIDLELLVVGLGVLNLGRYFPGGMLRSGATLFLGRAAGLVSHFQRRPAGHSLKAYGSIGKHRHFLEDRFSGLVRTGLSQLGDRRKCA